MKKGKRPWIIKFNIHQPNICKCQNPFCYNFFTTIGIKSRKYCQDRCRLRTARKKRDLVTRQYSNFRRARTHQNQNPIYHYYQLVESW